MFQFVHPQSLQQEILLKILYLCVEFLDFKTKSMISPIHPAILVRTKEKKRAFELKLRKRVRAYT